jgi:enamine deaminase RidA (YjgF/YER057c/UK114 family)
MSIDKRVIELGLKLPAPRSPIGSYTRTVRIGDILHVSGTGSRTDDGAYYGKVGRELSLEEGYQGARLCGLSVLATLRDTLQSLDKVKRIVAMTGFINAIDEFKDHPKVLNGASDVFIAVFGEENGRHARSAIGVSSLPVGLAVEIEVVVQCTSA